MSTNAGDGPRGDGAARAFNALRSVVRALNIGTRAIEQEAGVSLAQLFVLQVLAQHPAASLGELAERTATHQSSVSVVVQRLADRGLVERARAGADRRFVQIAITDEGRALLGNAPKTVQSRMIEGLHSLGDARQRLLASLLEQWSRAAGVEISAEAPMFQEDG